MKHTPEPWEKVYARLIIGGKEIGVAIDFTPDGEPVGVGIANIDRVITCVNACAGINPEAVPDLLKALEEIADHPHCQYIQSGPYLIGVTDGHRCAAKTAKAAIAKARP